MYRTMLKSKIHRAVVTGSNLNYQGSITIDSDILREANILEWEQVWVLNIDNGHRFVTYAIAGEPGSGEVCLNGAAARLVQVGDRIIVLSFSQIDEREAAKYKPVVLVMDEKNRITSRIR